MVAVPGEQALRHQLQEDRVVALEGGADVGVGFELREAVDGQVAGAAAAFARGLDRLRGVPAGGGLHPGRERLQPAAVAL